MLFYLKVPLIEWCYVMSFRFSYALIFYNYGNRLSVGKVLYAIHR